MSDLQPALDAMRRAGWVAWKRPPGGIKLNPATGRYEEADPDYEERRDIFNTETGEWESL